VAQKVGSQLDDAFASLNVFMKKLNTLAAISKSPREQKITGNMKLACVQFLQDNLPLFRMLKKVS
jgi:hypothetical protein